MAAMTIAWRLLLWAGLATCAAVIAGCGPAGSGDDDLTDQPCTPGAALCVADGSAVCREDGSGYDTTYCDPLQGLACEVDRGTCEGPCTADQLGKSYIGCEYWPTITGNEVKGTFEFGIAVSNTTGETALVTLEWGGLASPRQFTVDPGGVSVQTLPWVEELKGCMSYDAISCSGIDRPKSVVSARGAYHLRSTQPVTVYQFNPLNYQQGDDYSYTNDASLLLPTTAMGDTYLTIGWPYLAGNFSSPSLMAVTATQDDTQITIVPTTDTEASATVPALRAGEPAAFRLHQGDVLELFTFAGDFSGTVVAAENPVQVIAGHFCTYIPESMGYCDHLEESIFPLHTLSTEYVVSAPILPALPAGKVRYVRIVATQDDTTLTYDPPQPGAPTTLGRSGDVVEIPDTAATFVVRGDKEIIVAQFMEGQTVGGNAGDPDMALATPTVQWRDQYLFHTPLSYSSSYADIVAPTGVAVRLDGAPLTELEPIADTGFSLARVRLIGGNGNHALDADEPIGLSVYGYGQYTSYWYPGGLDLEEVYVP